MSRSHPNPHRGNSRLMTRRRMLKYSAGAAAMTFAASFMPPSVRRMLAQEPPRRASFKDIKHVVLLMQENRSFDHYFGTMAGVRGFDDPNAMKLPNGKSVFYQPDPKNPDGYLLPFHLDTHTTNAQHIPSTDHSWFVQHDAWNQGRMDNWVPAHRKADGVNGPYTMGYYSRDDIPFHFALAEAFTICDGFHCSMMGPTAPNRMYWMSGTVDPAGKYGGPITANDIVHGGYRWMTYPERLEKAGISWKVYQQEDNYNTNMLEYFKTIANADRNSSLHKRGAHRGPPGEFEYDAQHDRLPAVSWIMPTSFQCEHPDFLPADGAAFIAGIVEAIASNPEVWAKTVFILNYDENDGLFDHVAPPVPPPGTKDEFIQGMPIGAGFRVPCIIVSPWTAGGWVCSETFDHTSCLQFLEKFTGVREDNISAWRRQTFGDLTSAFRFDDQPGKVPPFTDMNGYQVTARYEGYNLPPPDLSGSKQTMPAQEKGERKRVPPAK